MATPTPEAKQRGAVGDDLPRLVTLLCNRYASHRYLPHSTYLQNVDLGSVA